MSGRFSDYRVQEWLSQLQEVWIGLHYDDPYTAGAYASELFGGSYERRLVKMSSAYGDEFVTSRGILSITGVIFSGLPSSQITHLGGWDAKINGNLEFSIALEEPVRTIAGGTFPITSGQIALSMD